MLGSETDALERLQKENFVGDEFKVDPARLLEPSGEYLIRERDPAFCEQLSKRMDANPYAVTAPLLLFCEWGMNILHLNFSSNPL